MCVSFVKCQLFIWRGFPVRLRSLRRAYVALFSIFLVLAIFDASFLDVAVHLPNENVNKQESRSTHHGCVYDAAQDVIHWNVDNKTRLVSSAGKVNDFSESVRIDDNSLKMEEFTKDRSNSLLRAYENPIITTKLFYQKGHDILPRNVCSGNGKDLILMVVITSSPANFAQRQAVRSTWATIAQRNDTDAAFLIGQSENHRVNQSITKESEIYGDIIRGNFIDTYNNLTLKSISMLEWTISHCNKTDFLLKTDDDVFINPDMLLAILKRRKTQRNAIVGRVARSWKLERNKDSKYYVPRTEYKNAMYPSFNTGPAYLLTNDIISPLYNASLEEVFFKLEDVFLTGLVARKLNIAHISYRQFYNRRPDSLKKCTVKRLATVHGLSPREIMDLWTEITNITLLDCPYQDDYDYHYLQYNYVK